MSLPGGVLVWHKVAPGRVDIEGVLLCGERLGNVWYQLATDLFKHAGRRGVEVKDRKSATFSLDRRRGSFRIRLAA
jgi:hypothetical protein